MARALRAAARRPRPVRFPDLPEAVTEGDDAADAGAQAADCLAEAIAGRINDGEPIPTPSRPAGMTTVGLEPVLAYKAALYGAMRTSNVTKSGLAKRLGIDEKDVRRLLDPRHRGSRLARLVEALAACDVCVAVALRAPEVPNGCSVLSRRPATPAMTLSRPGG